MEERVNIGTERQPERKISSSKFKNISEEAISNTKIQPRRE
jgi:hypothetical protein